MTSLTFRSRCGMYTMFCDFSAVQISVRLEKAQGPIEMINLFREDALRLKYDGAANHSRGKIFYNGLRHLAILCRNRHFLTADVRTLSACLDVTVSLWEEESGFWGIGNPVHPPITGAEFCAMVERAGEAT